MSYFFIINPEAGKKHKNIELLIDSFFSREKLDFKISYTEYRGHGRELSRKAIINGYRTVVAVGGDGTIREVAEPLIGREQCLGIIPCGSGNGLARSLYIPLNIKEVIRGISKWHEKKIDVGLANGKPFFCASGIGLDAEVARKFNNRKGMRGIFPYVYYSSLLFLKYKSQKVCIYANENKYEYFPLLVSILNAREYGGGAKIAPSAYLDDGFLNVVVVKSLKLFKLLKTLPDLFYGNIERHTDIIDNFVLKTLEIKCEKETCFHLDGEDEIVEDGNIRYSILPQMLKVKVPKLFDKI